MSSLNPHCYASPALQKSFHVTQTVRRANRSLFWGSVSGGLLAVVLYDMMYSCPHYTALMHFIERAIALLLGVNAVVLFSHYVWTSVYLQPVMLTPRQKRLLGINSTDPYFKMDTPGASQTSPSSNSRPYSTNASQNLSSSFMCMSSDRNESLTSPNYSLSSSSWAYLQPQSSTPVRGGSPASISPTPVPHSIIQDELSLSQYLTEHETIEKNNLVGSSIEQPSNLLSSFWTHPASKSTAEVSPLLRKCAYQMAPPSPIAGSSSTGSSDDPGSPSLMQLNTEIWKNHRISPSVLTPWTSNLRMWISQTILERVVREMAVVDEGLHCQGLVDVSVGSVGLERLRRTAQISQVAHNVPSLPALVPFLELSPNQEYIVQRIKELAKGGSICEYRWNSGGKFQGKEWADPLPTDAALVMHLLATYLDSQLPPNPSLPDGRPFTSQHLVRAPNKPSPTSFAIFHKSYSPPHYQLSIGSEIYDVPQGRNNLFHAVLLFLYHVKTSEHCMLGRINLGRSGLNMLWIIDS